MPHEVIKSEPAPWLRLLFILAMAIATAFLLVHFIDLTVFAIPNHDQSWLLYAAERVAAGVQLDGPRLVETNPPLIIWFSLIPVLLSQVFHAPPAAMLNVCVALMIAGSALWSTSILRRVGFLNGPVLLFLGACMTLMAETVLTNAEIGQREQFLIILLLPYLFAAASGATAKLSTIELCALGIVGGIGVCFKPQEALAVFCFEIALALGRRSLRRLINIDFLALFLTACTYLLLVRLITPDYLTHTIPLLGATYWAFGEDSVGLLVRQSPWFNIFFVAALVCCAVLWKRLRYPMVPLALLGCTAGATLAYFQQHTGWGNHQFPQISLLLLAICTIVLDLLSPFLQRVAAWKVFHTAFFSGVALCMLVLLPIVVHHRHRAAAFALEHESVVEKVFSSYPAGTPVYVLSTGLDGFPPVLRHNLIWGSRYVHLWMLPGLAKNEVYAQGGPKPKKILPAAEVQRISDLQRRETTEDLAAWKPTVVMVKLCRPEGICQAMTGIPFDVLGWFLRDPGFSAEWAHYRKQSGDGFFDVYDRVP